MIDSKGRTYEVSVLNIDLEEGFISDRVDHLEDSFCAVEVFGAFLEDWLYPEFDCVLRHPILHGWSVKPEVRVLVNQLNGILPVVASNSVKLGAVN